jgi:hypothetical protein
MEKTGTAKADEGYAAVIHIERKKEGDRHFFTLTKHKPRRTMLGLLLLPFLFLLHLLPPGLD